MSEAKKQRVCFISHYAYALFRPELGMLHGGSEVQVFQIGKELHKRGYAVSFLCGNFGQKRVMNFSGIHVYRQQLTHPRLLKIKVFWYARLFEFFRILKNIKPDIVIVRGAGPDIFQQNYFSFLCGAKFIFMAASDVDVDERFGLLSPDARRLYQKGLQMADAVVCQTNKQKENFLIHHGRESFVVPNSMVFSNNFLLRDRTIDVLWVGTSQKLKNPRLFLKIAQMLPKYNFTMIMPKHDPQVWEEIVLLARSVENLTFKKYVPFSEINDYFQKAKVFVNTSTYEGFPNTFIQAAMYGVPIVSLNVNPDDFLTVHDCGFWSDGNEKKMESYLSTLLTNHDKWSRQSENARWYALENHDLEKNVKKLENVFESLMK